MHQQESGFRNNSAKCEFHNQGYCKYQEKCRKEPPSSICQNKDCDTKCSSRHPKECKFKSRCRFLKKNICSFSHVNLVLDDENLEKKIVDIEKVVITNTVESDAKVKQLLEEINLLKKDNSENKCIVKKVEKENEVLENTLKQNKEHTNRQIEQITQENFKLEKEINIIKKKSLSDKADHDKAVKAVEDKCNKLVKDALAKQKVAEKEMIETMKKFKEELGNYSMFHNKMSNENLKEN